MLLTWLTKVSSLRLSSNAICSLISSAFDFFTSSSCSSLLMANASCSCSSSSPAVAGRAASSSGFDTDATARKHPSIVQPIHSLAVLDLYQAFAVNFIVLHAPKSQGSLHLLYRAWDLREFGAQSSLKLLVNDTMTLSTDICLEFTTIILCRGNSVSNISTVGDVSYQQDADTYTSVQYSLSVGPPPELSKVSVYPDWVECTAVGLPAPYLTSCDGNVT